MSIKDQGTSIAEILSSKSSDYFKWSHDNTVGTLSVADSAYYDNLPEGITAEVADKVHDYDNAFIYGVAKAGTNHVIGQMEQHTSVENATVTFTNGADTDNNVSFSKVDDGYKTVLMRGFTMSHVGDVSELINELSKQAVERLGK